MIAHAYALLPIVLASFATPASDLVATGHGPSAAQCDTPSCVQFTTEVRYGAYGYDHLVHIANGCPRAVACVIRTDVRTHPLSVEVDARSSTTVVTYRGSPARRFEADVRCRLQPEDSCASGCSPTSSAPPPPSTREPSR